MAPLAILLFLMHLSTAIAVTTNSIPRSTEQQVIATATPAVAADDDGQGAPPFLTSPSGSYAAYLRRGGGSAGGDVCYVLIQQQVDGGGDSVWESECTPVGGADTCDLAFSPVGLELFAGGHSLWDTGIDAKPATLSLDDGGDMSIVSEDGVTVWKASGDPWTGKQCGAAAPSPSTLDVLPLPSTTSAKLLTPLATTLPGPGSSGSFSFGDQPAAPADMPPYQPMPPPPADAELPGSPDQPLPLYSSPPPAPTPFGTPTPLPPLDTPPLAPPPDTGGEASPGVPLPGIAAGTAPFAPAPAGTPHPHGHQLPFGAWPAPATNALVPSSHAGFGQQQELFNGAGQPLEDSSGGWSGRERGRVAFNMALVGLMVLAFGF